ncbi:MAG: hypothetical protein E6Z15_10545, partial [Paenibacillus macerans]|nr:hypothetical protein [Paenibacillus macerans]
MGCRTRRWKCHREFDARRSGAKSIRKNLSFTESTIFGGNKWAGADNYIKLFTSDIEFWPSVRITLLYAALSLPIGVIGALLVAMLLNNKIKG